MSDFPRVSGFRGLEKAVIAALLGAAFPAQAQEPSAPAPAAEYELPELDASYLLYDEEELGMENLDAADRVVPQLPAGDPAEQPGKRWKLSPHLDVTGTFNDNIFIQRDDRRADFLIRFAPGIAAGIWEDTERMENYFRRTHAASVINPGDGNFIYADYTAILLGFARTGSQNTLEQDLLIEGQLAGEKLSVAARVHFEAQSEANIDVGGRVRRDTLSSQVVGRYEFSDKTAAELGAYNEINDPEDFVSSTEWRGEGWFEYDLTPLIDVALGGAAGVVDVDGGEEQVYQQALGRAQYYLSELLSAELRGGVEFRQSSGEFGDETNGVFSVRMAWTPDPETLVSLEAFREVDISAVRPDLDIVITGVRADFERLVRDRFYFTLAGGFQNGDYDSNTGPRGGGNSDAGRSDQFFFVRPGILYNFAHWGNIALRYEFRRNDSNRRSSSFYNNLVELQLSLRY